MQAGASQTFGAAMPMAQVVPNGSPVLIQIDPALSPKKIAARNFMTAKLNDETRSVNMNDKKSLRDNNRRIENRRLNSHTIIESVVADKAVDEICAAAAAARSQGNNDSAVVAALIATRAKARSSSPAASFSSPRPVSASLTPTYYANNANSTRRSSCYAAVSTSVSPTSGSLTDANGVQSLTRPSSAGAITTSSDNMSIRSDLTDSIQYTQTQMLGRLRVALQYSRQKMLLIITLNDVCLDASSQFTQRIDTGASTHEFSGCSTNASDTHPCNSGLANGIFATRRELSFQVRMALLSVKVAKQRTKYRNGVFTRQNTNTIVFYETFAFLIPPEELDESVVRLRVYVRRRPATSALIGEAMLRAALVDPRGGISTAHTLPIRAPLSLYFTSSHNNNNYLMSLFPPLLTRSTSPTLHQLQTTTAASGDRSSTFTALANSSAAQSSTLSGSAPSVAYAIGGMGNASARSSNGGIAPNFQLSFLSASNSGNCMADGNGSAASTPAGLSSRRNSTVDDCGRFCSLPQADGTPEVLVSLCYIQSQSKVVVAVEKATRLETFGASGSATSSSSIHAVLSGTSPSGVSGLSYKTPDTILRISVLSPDVSPNANPGALVETAKHKSDVVKGGASLTISCGAEPVIYNETAVFQVARNDLERVAILIQIFAQCGGLLRRKVPLGWVCVGATQSDAAARQHWGEMILGTGTTVDKWHHLVKTPYIAGAADSNT